MKGLFSLTLILLSFFTNDLRDDEFKGIYQTQFGEVSFVSYASLETIKASSSNLQGIIDPNTRKFAFSVSMRSFLGFNNPLQKGHFNENYVESNIYPKATFSGKIIERIDFSKNGKYKVRAKGKLDIHGVKQERIIKSEIVINDNEIIVNSNFTVLLKEHNILIPKIVNQKISREIIIKVNATLESR